MLEPGEPVLLEQGGSVFALIRRADPVDAITPYGYGGPVGRDVGAFWGAYDEWCRRNGVVTTFVRFHPLYGNARDAPVHVEPLASTIAWRLGQDDLEAGMHLNHRRGVRKARHAGVSVSSAEGVGEFVPLYEETMRRANATPFYFFAPEYWDALGRADVARFDAHLGDESVASMLCLASRPWLHYHLGASSDEGRRIGANTLLFLEAATWAKERGYERFHLGGGVGGASDSLHEYKRRFDPGGLVEAAVGKAVHDEVAYGKLTGGAAGLGGFFPAYRR